MDVILVTDLTQHLTQLSTDIGQAQKVLGARMTELTAELRQSSTFASKWARALVIWTGCLAFVSLVYTILYGVTVFGHSP